ncbi:hypothetical protein RB598_000162 [Gaeumannomyces tritici]
MGATLDSTVCSATKVFARRDVCRKHSLSLQCPSEGTQADPPLAKRGQKPRACDGCFRSRLACDNEQPLFALPEPGGVECSYERLLSSPNADLAKQSPPTRTRAVAASSNNSTVGSNEDGEHNAAAPASIPRDRGRERRRGEPGGRGDAGGHGRRLPRRRPRHARARRTARRRWRPASFLLSLTNPKAESMVRALINEPRCARDEELLMMPMATTSETCGGGGGSNTTEADDALDLFLPSPSGQPGILGDLAANGGLFANSSFFPWSLGPQSMDLDDFYVMKPDDSDLGCFTTATAEGCHADALSTSPGQQQLAPDAAAQEAAIAAVVDALQETHDWFARSGQAYDDGGALARPNVRALVSSYFRNTHHDFPLLHRASFSVEAAAPELLLLLAVVVLCGSLYSPPTDSALSCRGLFHLAEELAFRRLAAALAAAEEAADSAAAAGAAGGGGGGGRAQGRRGRPT